MGDLHSEMVASTFGAGGLGQVGTGRGGGGTGDHTVGLGGLNTMGKFGRGSGDGPGYGANKGGLLARHIPRTPDVFIGTSTVRGSLDKEIIRRIVRRNINQVRYCYTQGLAARPSLEGRAVVQFTIAPTGQVLASVLQSSTLNAVAVESCVVNAVKRWEFPKPDGGGLVIVSYPFQFNRPGE
jgi:TonB family protein